MWLTRSQRHHRTRHAPARAPLRPGKIHIAPWSARRAHTMSQGGSVHCQRQLHGRAVHRHRHGGVEVAVDTDVRGKSGVIGEISRATVN